ncbi:MAG: hypothetical protein ACOCZE_13340, partial [Planctomycetota bacterium]
MSEAARERPAGPTGRSLGLLAALLAAALAATVGVCSLFGPLGLGQLSPQMYLARLSTLLAAATAGAALGAAGLGLQG